MLNITGAKALLPEVASPASHDQISRNFTARCRHKPNRQSPVGIARCASYKRNERQKITLWHFRKFYENTTQVQQADGQSRGWRLYIHSSLSIATHDQRLPDHTGNMIHVMQRALWFESWLEVCFMHRACESFIALPASATQREGLNINININVQLYGHRPEASVPASYTIVHNNKNAT